MLPQEDTKRRAQSIRSYAVPMGTSSGFETMLRVPAGSATLELGPTAASREQWTSVPAASLWQLRPRAPASGGLYAPAGRPGPAVLVKPCATTANPQPPALLGADHAVDEI